MRRTANRNEYLRKSMNEMLTLGEDVTDDVIDRLLEELRHSSLIAAGDIKGDEILLMTAQTNKGDFGMLFTDIDEYRKVFPNFEVETSEHLFSMYQGLLKRSGLLGFVINFNSERFVLPREIAEMVGEAPVPDYSEEGAYTHEELKRLRDSIDNSSLEEFMEKPENLYDYEGLFDRISSSTLLTAIVSKGDMAGRSEDGMIRLSDKKPEGSLFIDRQGGNYATAYTSEEKISMVDLPENRYSQIIDFSHMANYVLHDDLDGIIINPRSDNIVITRDILLEFSSMIDETCKNSKLNRATSCMFEMEV